MKVRGKLHAPAALPLRERAPSTRVVELQLDAVAKRKIPTLPEIEPPPSSALPSHHTG